MRSCSVCCLGYYTQALYISGKSLLYSVVPSAFSLLFPSKHAYQLYTEPQEFAQNKKKFWPRGLSKCQHLLMYPIDLEQVKCWEDVSPVYFSAVFSEADAKDQVLLSTRKCMYTKVIAQLY